jgi:hypothetical protein
LSEVRDAVDAFESAEPTESPLVAVSRGVPLSLLELMHQDRDELLGGA